MFTDGGSAQAEYVACESYLFLAILQENKSRYVF